MADPSRHRPGISLIPARVAGRYEPLAKIASGGMATVYLARAVTGAGFGKLVALKCVHPHMAEQAQFVNMFLDEARIASRIDHPNVATVFDAGEDGGTHYLAMEYLHGEPMSSLIKAWDAEPTERPEGFCELAARAIADAAMGLHAAHELEAADGSPLGLVHRDISPHNLFLTFDGSVKVVDFGIAKAAGRLHETTTGVVKGKVAYMSPEQLHAEDLDRRTDVWALGVTLWEALTCRRLFKRGDQIATLNAVLEADIPRPSEVEPRVPEELDRIVMKALSRRREDRHATARELAQELNAFIAGRGVHVGMAELADLMLRTFAEEKAAKDAWVRRAREGRTTEPPPEPDAAVMEPTVSEVRPTRLTATEPIELPVRRSGLWVVAALALGLGAVLAGGLYLAGGPEDQAPERLATAEDPRPEDEPTGEPEAAASSPTGQDPPAASEEPEDDEVGPAHAKAPEPRPDPPSPRARRGRGPRTAPVPEPDPEPRTDRIPPAEASGPPRTVRIVHPGGGWANLRVDGQADRNTPTSLPPIAVGRHVIELRPYGQGPWQRHPVTVPPGGQPFVVRIPLPAP